MEQHLRAMGTTAHVVVVAPPTSTSDTERDVLERVLLERAVERIAKLEARWSRFVATSEVVALTRHAGTFVSVSADTALLVERAVEAYRESGGSFDPTVLGAVVRAGYDRSYELVASGAPAADGLVAQGWDLLRPGCEAIDVERTATGARVRLPAGTGFDPGGIGKGLAADLVTAEVLAAGAVGACVNLGGDVRARGVAPDGGPWTVAVEHPWRREPIALVGLFDGAVATSTTLRRTWSSDGVRRHHLIDPGTGLPSTSDLELATTVAAQGWHAEILAKAVLLRGGEHPFDLLGGTGVEALAVDRAGDVRCTPGLPRFTAGTAIAAHVRPPTPTASRLVMEDVR